MLNHAYFKENYRLIAVDLSKQKTLDADPRAIQQIVFQGVIGGDNYTQNKTINYSRTIKRNCFRILQKNSKNSVISINGWI